MEPDIESETVGPAAIEKLEIEGQDNINRRVLLDTHRQDPQEPVSLVKLTAQAQMNPATSQRAVSLPEMKLNTESNWTGPAAIEAPIEECLEGSNSSNKGFLVEPVSPVELTVPLLEAQLKPATLHRAVSMPEMELNTESNWMGPTEIEELTVPVLKFRNKEIGSTGKLMSLIQIFYHLDDRFLKACECAHEVSRILGYLSNFGHIDCPIDTEVNVTHAALLDIILAWEEKLYDEVKAGETMKHEYEKKIASLTKKDKQGIDVVSYEKLKAAASNVHTRYIVNMQSKESTVARINCLCDELLYPKLLQLLYEMATMWETMRYNHEIQAGIVHALKSLDSFQPRDGTSRYFRYRITQLLEVAREWYTQFCRLIDYQKDHVRALNSWLNVNIIPIEINLKDKVSSPPRDQIPPIHELVKDWNDALDKLPDEIARSALRNFAAVIQTISQWHEETKMSEKCDAARSELDRKSRQYENWCVKNGASEELGSENLLKIAKEDRDSIVISLKHQLEELQKIFRQERVKFFGRLRHQLLDLFRAMSEIALAFSVM